MLSWIGGKARLQWRDRRRLSPHASVRRGQGARQKPIASPIAERQTGERPVKRVYCFNVSPYFGAC